MIYIFLDNHPIYSHSELEKRSISVLRDEHFIKNQRLINTYFDNLSKSKKLFVQFIEKLQFYSITLEDNKENLDSVINQLLEKYDTCFESLDGYSTYDHFISHIEYGNDTIYSLKSDIQQKIIIDLLQNLKV